MPNQLVVKNNWNSGELSPELAGRPDFQAYANGAADLENFIPLPEGPIIKRGGSRMIRDRSFGAVHGLLTKDAYSWFVKFEYNQQQTFIIEFSSFDNALYFYYQGALILTPNDPNNSPYSIAHPYTRDTLTKYQAGINELPYFGLSIVQSADVLYIASGDLPIYKLERFSNTNWVMTPLNIIPPFKPTNTNVGNTINISDNGNTMFVYLNGGFSEDLVNRFIKLQVGDNNIRQWQQLTDYPADTIIFNDNKYYTNGNLAAKSGYIAPIHTKGTQSDGGMYWTYICDSIIYLSVFQKLAVNKYVATVITYPDNLVIYDIYHLISRIFSTATPYWAFNYWNITDGYPDQVSFFRQRLVFSQNQNVWFSKTGDYENFEAITHGVISDDSAISITISTEDTSQIQNLTATSVGLICSTSTDQVMVTAAAYNTTFAPTNIRVSTVSNIGSRPIKPVKLNNDLFIVDKSGLKIYNLQYDGNSETFQSTYINVLTPNIFNDTNIWNGAEQINPRPVGIIDMVVQTTPYTILWVLRNDGILVGITYDKEQRIVAFHRHKFGGRIQAIEIVENLLYITPVSINGDQGVYRAIEVVNMVPATRPNLSGGTLPPMENYLDSMQSILSTGSELTIDIRGNPFLYLSNNISAITADYATSYFEEVGRPNVNYITIPAIGDQYYYPIVNFGKPYSSKMKTMSLEVPTNYGTSQGLIKRMTKCMIRMYNTMGRIVLSPDFLLNLDFYNPQYSDVLRKSVVEFRDFESLVTVPSLFTGDKVVDLDFDDSQDGTIALEHMQPFQCKILSMIIRLSVNEDI